MNLTWYPLTPADQPVYTKYYSMTETKMTDLTFHCRFAWDNVFHIRWTVCEDCLIQISDGDGYTSPFMLMPLGKLTPEKLEKIVRAVRPVFADKGWPFRIIGIEESAKPVFEKSGIAAKIDFEEDSSDYFYDAELLRTLPGKKYAKKRNHWSKFLRMYPDYQYETLSPDLFGECLKLVGTWASDKGIDIADTTESDYYMIKRIFDNWDSLKARGGAIRIGGKIVAFSIGSVGQEEVGFIHFEKADIQYDGLYAAINKLVLEHEFPSIRYVNREEDMGIPGLRQSKESYFPICKIRKWRFVPDAV
ncbi:MAG: DUF2156 domain-containing protein [Clostridiales bacterium]|nr:DUF2156 domain-containing protein [Clostridiales bacterium]